MRPGRLHDGVKLVSGQPTTIYRAASTQQAHLLKGLLEERGIAAWVVNDSIQLAGGELPLGWTAAPCVVVGEDDAPEARQFAENFDLQTAHDPTPDDEPESDSTDWKDWPVCPECGERRSARCPVCGVSGSQFELTDIQETESGQRVLLMCDACDDHFLPEFFRLCHRCGHDYGDGHELPRPMTRAEFNSRLWIVAAGLLIGTALIIGYFSILLRKP
jgi:hypothetical protein